MLRVWLAVRLAVTLVFAAGICQYSPPVLAASNEAEASCAEGESEACVQEARTDEDFFTSELWGFFTSPKDRTLVIINSHPDNDSPYLQFGNGPKHSLSASWVTSSTCRNQETGLDQIYIEPHDPGSGVTPVAQIYRVHPETNIIEFVYETDFLDEIGWQEEILIDAEGNCRWQELEDSKHALSTALVPLMDGEGQPADFEVEVGETVDLASRPLATETVRSAFLAIHEIGIVNAQNLPYEGRAAVPRSLAVDVAGARYVSADDSESWLVVQITREACDAPGIVLVQNKHQGTWRSIHELSPDQLAAEYWGSDPDFDKSDCAAAVGFARRLSISLMGDFHIKGDKLFAAVCLSGCVGSFRGRPFWAWFEIDLLGNTATRLREAPDFVPVFGDVEDEAAVPNLADIAR